MEWLVKSGVDGVITNNPGLLRSVVQQVSEDNIKAIEAGLK